MEMNNQDINVFRGFLMSEGKYKHGMTRNQIIHKVAKILKSEYNIILDAPPKDSM